MKLIKNSAKIVITFLFMTTFCTAYANEEAKKHHACSAQLLISVLNLTDKKIFLDAKPVLERRNIGDLPHEHYSKIIPFHYDLQPNSFQQFRVYSDYDWRLTHSLNSSSTHIGYYDFRVYPYPLAKRDYDMVALRSPNWPSSTRYNAIYVDANRSRVDLDIYIWDDGHYSNAVGWKAANWGDDKGDIGYDFYHDQYKKTEGVKGHDVPITFLIVEPGSDIRVNRALWNAFKVIYEGKVISHIPELVGLNSTVSARYNSFDPNYESLRCKIMKPIKIRPPEQDEI